MFRDEISSKLFTATIKGEIANALTTRLIKNFLNRVCCGSQGSKCGVECVYVAPERAGAFLSRG